MRLFILILLLFYSIVAQEYHWKHSYHTQIVYPNTSQSLEIANDAKEIRYTIVCTTPCDIYLMTMDDYQNMNKNKTFKYLRYKPNTESDSATWSNLNDLSNKLVLSVVNRSQKDLAASFDLEQFVPGAQPHQIVAIIVLSVAFGICCFLFCVLSLIGIIVNFFEDWLPGILKYEKIQQDDYHLPLDSELAV
jgi:hypothetical protein